MWTEMAKKTRDGVNDSEGSLGSSLDRISESDVQRLRPKSSASAPSAGILTCTRGPDVGSSLELRPGKYTIGRARENAIVLKDIAASRKHVRIEVLGTTVKIFDLGSGNGTRLNGRRIQTSGLELAHGDRVEIGGSTIVFTSVGKPTPKIDNSEGSGRIAAHVDALAAEVLQRQNSRHSNQELSTSSAILPPLSALADERNLMKPMSGLPAQRHAGYTEPPRAEMQTAPPYAQGPSPRQGMSNVRHGAALPSAQGPIGTTAVGAASNKTGIPAMVWGIIGLGAIFVLIAVVVFVVWGGSGKKNPDISASSASTVIDPATAMTNLLAMARNYEQQGDFAKAIYYAEEAVKAKPDDVGSKLYRDALVGRKQQAEMVTQNALPTTKTTIPTTNTQPSNNVMPTTAIQLPESTTSTGMKIDDPPRIPPKKTTTPKVSSRTTRTVVTDSREDGDPPPKKISGGGSMGDAQAKSTYEQAVQALKDKETETGCSLLQKVANKAPSDSKYKDKAANLISRRCE